MNNKTNRYTTKQACNKPNLLHSECH